jgi:hypothetical protein
MLEGGHGGKGFGQGRGLKESTGGGGNAVGAGPFDLPVAEDGHADGGDAISRHGSDRQPTLLNAPDAVFKRAARSSGARSAQQEE